MALGNCRECGNQVSSEAVSCPHCGLPKPVAVAADPGLAGSAVNVPRTAALMKEEGPFLKTAESVVKHPWGFTVVVIVLTIFIAQAFFPGKGDMARRLSFGVPLSLILIYVGRYLASQYLQTYRDKTTRW